MKHNSETDIPTTIVQAESHTPEELFGNWEVALKQNAKSVYRGKKLMRILLVSFLIDIFLTCGFFYNTAQTHEAIQRAAISTCISGNHARYDNRQLWDTVIQLSHVKQPSKTLIEFEKYLQKATTPRDCYKVIK